MKKIVVLTSAGISAESGIKRLELLMAFGKVIFNFFSLYCAYFNIWIKLKL